MLSFFAFLEKTWEQRKVTELGKIFIGLVTTMTEHYTDEGVLLIRNSDIKDGRFEFGDNPIYLEESFAQANSSRMHQLGDVITVHTGDVGTSSVIREKQVNSIGFATIVTRPNTRIITSDYLCAYLNTDQHKKWAVGVSTGDGRTNYNLGDYYECIVPVPTLEEQKKISEFISYLNNLITLHQRQYSFFMQINKNSFVENSWEQNIYAWEQRKLGEECVITMGQSPDGSTYSDVPSDYILVQGNADLKDGWVNPRMWTTQKTKTVQAGDLIMSVRAPAGAMGKTAFDAVIGRGVAAIKGNEFIYQLLVKMDLEGYWKSLSSGSTFESLNSQNILNAEIAIPDIEEQKLIGEYFQNLDHLITLHQRKPFLLRNGGKQYVRRL